MSLIDELVDRARLRARSLSRGEPNGRPQGRSFAEVLRGKDRLSVIAEYKKASPSLGAIAEHPLEKQLERYVSAGAAAVSVLTEPTYFRGSLEDLETAAALLEVPVLMKDFVVEPAQVRAAARLGARAVLLIVRCLSRSQLDELAAAAEAYGLTPLIECHRPAEVGRALLIDPAVIGVNNRDLDTLEIDRSLAPKLLAEIPSERTVVAESGYEDASQTRELEGLADGILIGSALMRSEDPASLIRAIRGENRDED